MRWSFLLCDDMDGTRLYFATGCLHRNSCSTDLMVLQKLHPPSIPAFSAHGDSSRNDSVREKTIGWNYSSCIKSKKSNQKNLHRKPKIRNNPRTLMCQSRAYKHSLRSSHRKAEQPTTGQHKDFQSHFQTRHGNAPKLNLLLTRQGQLITKESSYTTTQNNFHD